MGGNPCNLALIIWLDSFSYLSTLGINLTESPTLWQEVPQKKKNLSMSPHFPPVYGPANKKMHLEYIRTLPRSLRWEYSKPAGLSHSQSGRVQKEMWHPTSSSTAKDILGFHSCLFSRSCFSKKTLIMNIYCIYFTFSRTPRNNILFAF